MTDKFVLVVSDEGDDKHGEISVLDTAHEAERLVETLLEAGFEQDRVRVFAGAEAEFVTNYRPVVTFTDESGETKEADLPVSHQTEPEVVEVGAETTREPVEMHSGNGNGNARPESRLSSVFAKEGEEVGAKAEAETVEAHSGNGHSMSAQFRSARDDARDVYISASEAAG